jgi:acetyltransferase-like isoleucine patch superfamily enzyme
MINYLWRKIKLSPLLSDTIASIYFYVNNVHRKISGVNNSIQIDIQNNFPFLKEVFFDIVGNNNLVSISSGDRLANCNISICGNNNKIIIEANVQGSCDLWIVGNECQIIIGKFTTINKANIGAAETKSSVTIGEDCMLAHGIDIRCSDSHSIIDLSSNQRINYAQDINIENHVWIGANVQILKGVCIGSNSVIASGAIVTKNIPDNSIAAGIPAQVKRTNVTWTR